MRLAYRYGYYDRGSDLDMLVAVFWDENKNDWVTRVYPSMSSEYEKYLYSPLDEEASRKYNEIAEHVECVLECYNDFLNSILYECPLCGKETRAVRAKWVRAKLGAWGRDDVLAWCPNCRVTIHKTWCYNTLVITIYKYVKRSGFKYLVRFERWYRMYEVPPHEQLDRVVKIYARKTPEAEKIISKLPVDLKSRVRWEEENEDES